MGLAVERDDILDLTEPGAFWLHLAQNYVSLSDVNTIWTLARRDPWQDKVTT